MMMMSQMFEEGNSVETDVNMMEMMMMSQMFGGGSNPFESLLGMFGGETSKEQTVAELKAEKEKLEKELNALKDSLTKL